MSFSTTTPTAAGWYWLINQNYPSPTVVQLQEQRAGTGTNNLTGNGTNKLSSSLQVVSPQSFTLDGTEQWEGPLIP